MPMSGRLGGLRDSLTGRTPEPAAVPVAAPHGPQRVITVLGMHRSGTSSLVGSLAEAGLPLGEVRTAGGDSNEKGHREPGELIKLHDDVLICSGGAWHQPPATVTWTKKHRKRRDEFVASRSGLSLWGWKEPRTLLVMDGWLEVLPDLGMVGTFRHPAVVARSLQRRHGNESADMWLDVWLAYNGSLLALVEARSFPLIDFDLPAEAYQARLRDIFAELELRSPGDDSEFFDASLRTSQQQTPPDMALPAEVERVYYRLVAIAAEQAAHTG
jgi:hypothetical protein